MGKFLVIVSGVECDGSPASAVFFVEDDDDETIYACVDVFNEGYDIDNDHKLIVDPYDIDDLSKNFNCYGGLDKQAIELANKRSEKIEEEEKELLVKLMSKYGLAPLTDAAD